MSTVTSADGTSIAFDRAGQGPAVILVDGALCYRASGPMQPLAKRLVKDFTVYTYDRRGRGESGDTSPYTAEREVEDIEALIKEAGGSAFMFGISSGAGLALEACARLGGVTRLALFEAPFIVDDSRDPVPPDYIARLQSLIAADKRGAAVRMFMKTVGVPAPIVALMRFMPPWPRLKRVAHTLPYDFTVLSGTMTGKPLPAERWSGVTVPTLVMDGGKSPAWIRTSMRQLAEILPSAEYRTLPGQTHMLKPDAVAPVLAEFFGA